MVIQRRALATLVALVVAGLANTTCAVEPLVIEEARVALLHDIRIPALEAGVLLQLDVREGTRVTQGQIIGQIDDSIARAELEVARLQQLVADVQAGNDVNLRFSEKSREVADADVSRAQNAIAAYAKSISRAEIDQLRLVAERSLLAREQAELELNAARFTSQYRAQEVTIAQQRLANRRLVAPADGMIVEVQKQVGEWVQPGDPIARLVRTDRMRVEAFVDGYRYGASLVGKNVTFAARVPSAESLIEWQGVVTFVSPIMHPVTGDVMLLAEIENDQSELRAGMIGTLRIAQ